MKAYLKTVRIVWMAMLPFSLSAQSVISVSNESFFSVVIPLLDEGKKVTITATGNGMMPTIKNGAKVLLEKRELYEIGDIVLAHLSRGQYVLYRIHAKTDSTAVLKGDANVTEESCPLDSIKANVSKMDTLVPADLVQPLDTSKIGYNRWMIKPLYDIRKIGDTVFLLPKQTSHMDLTSVTTLNETAEFVFISMKGRIFNLNDCVDALLQEYDVDRQTVTLDCVNLLKTWYTIGIIEKQ